MEPQLSDTFNAYLAVKERLTALDGALKAKAEEWRVDVGDDGMNAGRKECANELDALRSSSVGSACEFASLNGSAACRTHDVFLKHDGSTWICPTTGTLIPFGVSFGYKALRSSSASGPAAPDRLQPILKEPLDRPEPIATQYPLSLNTAGLNDAQLKAAKEWAADDRLWTTQDTVEFNLRTFARVILSSASVNGSVQWPL